MLKGMEVIIPSLEGPNNFIIQVESKRDIGKLAKVNSGKGLF